MFTVVCFLLIAIMTLLWFFDDYNFVLWTGLIYDLLICLIAFCPFCKKIPVAEKMYKLVHVTPKSTRKGRIVAYILFAVWAGMDIFIITFFKLRFDTFYFVLIPIVASAFCQEVLFKGFLFNHLYYEKKLNFWLCLLIDVFIFVVCHNDFTATRIIQLTLASLFSFLMYHFYPSVFFLGIYHTMHNFFVFMFVTDNGQLLITR